MAPTRCARCSAPFDCRAREGGCWCNDVSVDPRRLAELAVSYESCLCPDCLRAEGALPPQLADEVSP